MKVVSILMALLNSLAGSLLILSCVSASESMGWIILKTGAGIMAIYLGILTFKDGVLPLGRDRVLLNGLILVIVGTSTAAWGIHWSILSGDVKSTPLLFGAGLFLQGLSSLLGMIGSKSRG